MTILLLAMISLSASAYDRSVDSSSVADRYRSMPPRWISACDEWLREQSSKHRKLVHYQISCLVYLAKRMNLIRKKRFWKETGSLIQDAIMDGLHCEPSSGVDSVYMREMKRRIWAVIRELDLQNAYEYGLPTLLHTTDSDIAAPANLDDEDFDEQSEEMSAPKPLEEHKLASYQCASSRSWTLRLEISQRLSSAGTSQTLEYEDVLRYTHELTHEINTLPTWDMGEVKSDTRNTFPIIAKAFLQFQLIECLLTIHRPYLQKNKTKFWLSENVSYQMSRDVLLLNQKLASFGIQALTVLRDDLMLASLTLVRITMLQPRGECFFQSSIELYIVLFFLFLRIRDVMPGIG
jgi:hypothetical protein